MESEAYYNQCGVDFAERTLHRDMSAEHERFIQLLPQHGRILDAGCGSGRDSKAFIDAGFQVEAFDASQEMVRIASEWTDLDVRHMRFQDLDVQECFNGIWACASLLHVPHEQLREVMQRLHRSLKTDGVLFASFKMGADHRHLEDRHFFDQNDATFWSYVEGLFTCIEQWEAEDLGRGSAPSKKWFNVLLRKSV